MEVLGAEALEEAFEELADGLVEDQYEVGTDLDYGGYLEVGTSRHPPYPWLGPAIAHIGSMPIEEALGLTDDPEDLLETIAQLTAEQARINVSAGSRSGRSPGTHPAHPQVQSGDLRDSIQYMEK